MEEPNFAIFFRIWPYFRYIGKKIMFEVSEKEKSEYTTVFSCPFQIPKYIILRNKTLSINQYHEKELTNLLTSMNLHTFDSFVNLISAKY